MSELPQTRYAKAGDLSIAYQVAGAGLTFTDRGEHALAGVPEPWRLLAVGV